MDKLIYAKAKYVGKSPRKTRLVVDLIRGKAVDLAMDILEFNEKAAAVDVQKVLKSAIANAVNNNNLDKKELYVAEARVDEAPSYKRGRPASKGRYTRIIKRNCHIIIGVQTLGFKNEVKLSKPVKSETVKQEKVEKPVEEKTAKKTEARKSTKKISSKKATK